MTFLADLPYNLFVLFVYLFILVVLVAAHELGHYLVARLFGMGAEEFAVGMGGRPWVLGRRSYLIPLKPGDDPHFRGETNRMEGGEATEPAEVVDTPQGPALRETTLFTVRPLPLGGFVRIKGMVPQEDGGETQIPGGFFSKSPFKRWLVLAAGPLFSLIAGVLLVVPTLTIEGIHEPSKQPVIGAITETSLAAKAGLKEGDRVLSIDGKPVARFYDLMVNVRDKGTNPIRFVVDRGGQKVEVEVVGKVDERPTPVITADLEPSGELRRQTKIGVGPQLVNRKLEPGEAAITALKLPFQMARELLERATRPKELIQSLGGPGTMVKATAMNVDRGFWSTVSLAGLLSISLGIFNLLPFPPLDGGQMWIAMVEMLRGGRRLSLRTQETAIKFGFAFVLALIACVLVIDIQRWTGMAEMPGMEQKK